MKRIKYLIIALFIALIPGLVRAANITQVTTFDDVPDLDKTQYNIIYITSLKKPTITVTNSMFKKYDYKKSDGTIKSAIGLKADQLYQMYAQNEIQPGKTFNNVGYVKYDDVGYYIDKDGNKKVVDMVVNIDNTKLKGTDDGQNTVWNNIQYVALLLIAPTTLDVANYTITGTCADTSCVSSVSTTDLVGAETSLSISFYDQNGKKVSDKVQLKWKITDIDAEDHISNKNISNNYSGSYTESIQFNSGFHTTFFTLSNTVLNRSNSNTRFTATVKTGDGTNISNTRSGVYAIQNSNTAGITWWGTQCATHIIAVQSDAYPNATAPTKSTENDIVKMGEAATYTISQEFPDVTAVNKASSITVTDTFDKNLDISSSELKVLDGEGKDVTANWEMKISDQKVTITTVENYDLSKVKGKYSFVISGIVVMDADYTGYEKEKSGDVTYYIIPNTATVIIKTQTGETMKMNTETVKIKTYKEGSVTPVNPSTGLILPIGILAGVGAISGGVFYFVKRKNTLKKL